MTYLLSKETTATLSRFLKSRVLLAFDFDGTLAPIVVDRNAARMRRRTLRLLERICKLYPCAVISGRAQQDVLARLEGLPVKHVVGNHGLLPTDAASAFRNELEGVCARIERGLGSANGIDLEDKGYSVAVHYRRAKDRRRTRQQIERSLANLDGACRIVAGKLVFDVVASAAPHKGNALTSLRRAESLETAIYVGDDATDEDVFRLGDPDHLLSVRIGRSRFSAAPYFLRDQRELDLFLDYATHVRG